MAGDSVGPTDTWLFANHRSQPDRIGTGELGSFSNESLERFNLTPEDAAAFLSYGEKPKDPKIPEVELAALSFSMSALLNLDETLTRD